MRRDDNDDQHSIHQSTTGFFSPSFRHIFNIADRRLSSLSCYPQRLHRPQHTICTLDGNYNKNCQTILVSSNQIMKNGVVDPQRRWIHRSSKNAVVVVADRCQNKAMMLLLNLINVRNNSHHHNDHGNGSSRRQLRRWVHTHRTTPTIYQPQLSSDDDDQQQRKQQEQERKRKRQEEQQQRKRQKIRQRQLEQKQFVVKVHTTASQIQRNKLIVTYGQSEQWSNILDLFQIERQDYGIQNLATTLSQLAKIPAFLQRNDDHHHHHYQIFHDVMLVTADHIDVSVIDTRCYANIFHSIAKLRRVLWQDDAAHRIINHLADWHFAKDFLVNGRNPQGISNVCWSLVQLQRPDLMETLLLALDGSWVNTGLMIDGDNPQHASNIIWACAKLGQSPSRNLMSAMERRFDWLVQKGSAPAIAGTAWALATLGHQSPALFFTALEERADWFVENGDAQEIADTAWACAELSFPAPALFQAIAKRSFWLVSHGTPETIATTAWAFEKLGHPPFALFHDDDDEK